MATVMATEQALGRLPRDVSAQRGIGYDIESKDPSTGALYFIEVKGKWHTKTQVVLTKNEVLCARNAAEQFRLAIVLVDETGPQTPYYLKELPFNEPVFTETASIHGLDQLLTMAEAPC